MGSLVSPIVANLYMEYFEQKALSTAPTPRFWHRYVADTCVIHKEIHKQEFLQHINSVDPAILFIVETNKENGAIPFLDTIVKPEADRTLSITVYRKPTHTDQYLEWDSHHHLSAKYSVILTLSHRAQTVCSHPELLHKEKAHLRNVLTQCKYPKWALDKWREGLICLLGRLLIGLTTRTPQVPSLLPMKLKPRVTLSYPPHKVSVNVSRRSVGGIAYRPILKVVILSGTYRSPPRTKTLWSAKVGQYIGSNVVTSPVMMNT